jgi:hypothetical protein
LAKTDRLDAHVLAQFAEAKGCPTPSLLACYLGWQESLILLAKLVEAEIPG